MFLRKIVVLFFIFMLFAACSDDEAVPAVAVGPQPVSLIVFSGVNTNSIYIKWSASNEATNYRLKYRSGGSGSMILLTNSTGTAYNHTNLTPGVTYQYQLIVESAAGQSLNNSIYEGSTAPVRSAASVGSTNFYTNNGLIYTHDPAAQLKPANELTVLTLNMHTYQESDQDVKFDTIVQLIAEQDVDVIAFQENAQHRNAAVVYDNIRSDNMCIVITNRLKTYYGLDYYFTWDWAHYGWNEWEEGIAVMAKYSLAASDSTYVSTAASTGDITSRKVIYGRFFIPGLNINLNFFSTHLHWRTSVGDTEQNNQVTNVKAFATSKLAGADLTIVCGDYNSQPTETDPVWSEGYTTMKAGGEYLDTFLEFNPAANNMPENSIYDTVKGAYPGRIDYIFMRTNAAFGVVSSQIIFTPSILGEVSDHYGVLTRIRKVQ